MSKHTPEPWTFDGFRISTDGTRETRVTNVDGNFVSIEPDIANGERIVACVNALAGIDDPAAFVAAVDAILRGGTMWDVYQGLEPLRLARGEVKK